MVSMKIDIQGFNTVIGVDGLRAERKELNFLRISELPQR